MVQKVKIKYRVNHTLKSHVCKQFNKITVPIFGFRWLEESGGSLPRRPKFLMKKRSDFRTTVSWQTLHTSVLFNNLAENHQCSWPTRVLNTLTDTRAMHDFLKIPD